MSRGKRKHPQTAAWAAYWAGGAHPDSILSGSEGASTHERVLAPFSGEEGEHRTTKMDQRESFYCHHYRLPGEHYHKTMSELEGCEQ